MTMLLPCTWVSWEWGEWLIIKPAYLVLKLNYLLTLLHTSSNVGNSFKTHALDEYNILLLSEYPSTSGTAKWLLRNCYHISLEIMKTTLWMFRNNYGVMWLSRARKGQNLVCSFRSYHGITCVERGILPVVSTYFLWDRLALPGCFNFHICMFPD